MFKHFEITSFSAMFLFFRVYKIEENLMIMEIKYSPIKQALRHCKSNFLIVFRDFCC